LPKAIRFTFFCLFVDNGIGIGIGVGVGVDVGDCKEIVQRIIIKIINTNID